MVYYSQGTESKLNGTDANVTDHTRLYKRYN